jgi:hypothetical protein
MGAKLWEALSAIAKAHKKLKKPKEMGSTMAVKRKK